VVRWITCVYTDSPTVAAGVGSGGGLLYAAGVPYTFHNGLAMFNPLPQTPQGSAGHPGTAAFPDAYTLATLPQVVSDLSYSLIYLLTLSPFLVKEM